MTKRFDLLVFDWDGTLMDSQAHIVTCFQKAIAELGLPTRTPMEIRYIIGLGLDTAIQHLFPEASPAQWEALAHQYRQHFFSTNALPTPLFPGTEETIRHLYEQGYLLAVATGKSRRGLNHALETSGLSSFFVTSRCADETCSKPNPQMLQEIMLEVGIPPEKTVMIGDTEYDLHMAALAGVAAIGVTYGVHDKENLLACNPMVCLDDLTQLTQYI